jgi:hypothetical protein
LVPINAIHSTLTPERPHESLADHDTIVAASGKHHLPADTAFAMCSGNEIAKAGDQICV